MRGRVAFHIGYHKTASTWFQQEALPRHPGFRPLFTTNDRRDPLVREIVLTPRRSFEPSRVRELLEQRVDELEVPDGGIAIGSQERLSGHAATGGFDTFEIADRLAAIAPEAKIFAVVREQVDMIESEYLQLIQEGSQASIDWLLSFEPTFASLPGFDLGHYEYDRLADRYVDLFGADGHRLFEFRSFCDDPRGFLDGLASFLAIDEWPTIAQNVLRHRSNPPLPRRLLGTRRFMNQFERRPLNPHPVVGLPPVWRGPLWWLATRLPRQKKQILSAETRAALRARYQEPNQRLARRHGITFALQR